MAKKNRDNDEEEFDDELENSEYIEDSDDSDDDSDSESDFDLGDDFDEIDIVIEIDDEDLLTDDKPIEEEDDIVLSKHKIDGKHSLKYDSIFKGKKEDPLSEDELDGFAYYHKETIEVDKSSNYYFESIDNESYIRSKLVKEKVYDVLVDEFGIDKLITGVVLFTDYENSTFKVDSYENIYDIHISKITKILNNEKFKYNLNKLNNIDFL